MGLGLLSSRFSGGLKLITLNRTILFGNHCNSGLPSRSNSLISIFSGISGNELKLL